MCMFGLLALLAALARPLAAQDFPLQQARGRPGQGRGTDLAPAVSTTSGQAPSTLRPAQGRPEQRRGTTSAGQPQALALPPATVCGQQATPLAQPPDGSGPVVLYIAPCFDAQGNASLIEAQTYLYYIQL